MQTGVHPVPAGSSSIHSRRGASSRAAPSRSLHPLFTGLRRTRAGSPRTAEARRRRRPTHSASQFATHDPRRTPGLGLHCLGIPGSHASQLTSSRSSLVGSAGLEVGCGPGRYDHGPRETWARRCIPWKHLPVMHHNEFSLLVKFLSGHFVANVTAAPESHLSLPKDLTKSPSVSLQPGTDGIVLGHLNDSIRVAGCIYFMAHVIQGLPASLAMPVTPRDLGRAGRRYSIVTFPQRPWWLCPSAMKRQIALLNILFSHFLILITKTS